MMKHARLLTLLVFAAAWGLSSPAEAKEVQAKDALGRDYWLYTPDDIDPDKTYTLVVGVHGARGNGKGAAGMSGWVNEHDVIVLGPSYLNDDGAFQYLAGDTDKQTIDLFKQLRKQYKLHDKLFIAGFSGGSQYAHRFAMKYPEIVAGCAAHSGGTWGTGDYPPNEPIYVNPKARDVLFVISCGENDTKKSFGQAPLGRLAWAKKYERMLAEGGFIYDAQWVPGVGHNYSRAARQMTEDCFVASTRLLPAYEAERQAIVQALRKRDAAGGWALVKARRADGSAEKGGIIAKVHGLYLDSLSAYIDRMDLLAERAVRQAVRKHDDPAALRAALKELAKRYDGAPKTMEAIGRELAKID